MSKIRPCRPMKVSLTRRVNPERSSKNGYTSYAKCSSSLFLPKDIKNKKVFFLSKFSQQGIVQMIRSNLFLKRFVFELKHFSAALFHQNMSKIATQFAGIDIT